MFECESVQLHITFFHTFECISTTLSSTDTMKVNREDRMEERVTNIEKCCEETYTCADFDSCDDGNVKRPAEETELVQTFAKYREKECCTTGKLCTELDTEAICNNISYVRGV
mgnify:CR=1 FL=1